MSDQIYLIASPKKQIRNIIRSNSSPEKLNARRFNDERGVEEQ